MMHTYICIHMYMCKDVLRCVSTYVLMYVRITCALVYTRGLIFYIAKLDHVDFDITERGDNF